jgi:uncharacterized protein (TIGR02145 family)
VQICDYFKPKKAKMTIRFLTLLLLTLIGIAQTNAQLEMPISGNTVSEKQPLEIKRNALYNLEEIKVRWKKAALENCPGVPCVVAPPAPSFTCGTSTVLDFDGNAYNTVSIGNQCWTTTNLKVTKYNDGTSIPDSTNSTWGTAAIGARTEYVGVGTPSSGYVGTYGYLYNWYAAADTRKLCPAGWHVPTDGQWTALIQFLVPSETLSTSSTTQSLTAGRLMKKNDALWSTNTGTNTSGFSALPGGYRAGNSGGISTMAFFWSATQDNVNVNNAWNRNLFTLNQVFRDNNYIGTKSVGYSIRCLMD